MIEVGKLAGLVSLILGYLTLLVLAWGAVLGAGRLSLVARYREHQQAGTVLDRAPGRCYLAGLGGLFLGWIALALLKSLHLLALLFLLAWVRKVFRGLVGVALLRGRQLREGLDEAPGSEAEAFGTGLLALALASALPVLGWGYLALVLVQGLGAEILAPRSLPDEVPGGASGEGSQELPLDEEALSEG